MSSCEIADPGGQVIQIHMVLEGTQLARAVSFFAPTPQCWPGATWLGDVVVSPYLKQNYSTHVVGVIVNFLVCVEPPVYFGYMNFLASGQSEPCCEYVILPNTQNGELGIFDCGFDYVPGLESGAIVNANQSCRCPRPVAAEQSTWGRVKSLYR